MALPLAPLAPERIEGWHEPPPTPSVSNASNMLSKQKSMLSQLLEASRGPACQGLASSQGSSQQDEAQLSEYDDDDDDEEMEEEEEDDGAVEEAAFVEGSLPVEIPSNVGFLKSQHEALKRMVYLHQIEEMRRQCQAYFERQERLAHMRGDGTRQQAVNAEAASKHAKAQPNAAAARQQPGYASALHHHQPGF